METLVSRLPVNFHLSFMAERRYLAALMAFASEQGSGTLQTISHATDIPTGESSGKVMPTIRYAEGMGLIVPSESEQGVRRLKLTPLGQTIFREDRFLKEAFTQWLLHLHLCRAQGGAEVWYLTFTCGAEVLGHTFSEEALETYLASKVQSRSRSIKGPMVTMYAEESSFLKAGCLKPAGGRIERRPPPLDEEFSRGYAYLLLRYWDTFFPGERQIVLTQFEERTQFFASTGWGERGVHEALERMASVDAIRVDRQIGSPLLLRLTTADTLLPRLFDDLA